MAALRRKGIKSVGNSRAVLDSLEPRRLLAVLMSGAGHVGTVAVAHVVTDTFTASAGDSALLVVGDAGGTGTPFWANVKIYAPDNALIDAATSTTATAFDLTNLPASGTYRVEISNDWGNGTGTYRATLAKIPATQAADTGESLTLQSGRRVEATIESADIDVYPIQLVAGRPFLATMNSTATGGFFSSSLELWDPAGRLLARDADFANGSELSIASVPSAGTYYLVARDGDGFGASPYALTAIFGTSHHNDPAGIESTTLLSGEQITAALNGPGDLDVYTFSAFANDAITIAADDIAGGSTIDPYLTLIAPDGSILQSGTGSFGFALQQLAAPMDGIYTVVIQDFDTNADGAYGISISVISGPQSAEPGQSVTPPLGTSVHTLLAGDIDVFEVTAIRGASLQVTVAEGTDGSTINPTVELFGPDGRLLSSATSNGNTTVRRFSLPVSGTYYIQVRSNGGSGLGEYSADLSLTGGADSAAPALDIANSAYEFDAPLPRLRIGFDEDVRASLDLSDLTILNLATNQSVSLAGMDTAYVGALSALRVNFNTILPDGNYRVTIRAGGVGDAAGNTNTVPYSFDFFVLAGDINRDRVVNFSDLLILAQNYGQTDRTFSQGNIDYSADGAVGFGDLLLLAQRYGTSLAVASPTLLTTKDRRESLSADVLK